MATSRRAPSRVLIGKPEALRRGELVAARLDTGQLALYRIERVLRRAPSGQAGVIRTRYAARRASVAEDGKLKLSQHRYSVDSRYIQAVGEKARRIVLKLQAEEAEAERDLLDKLLGDVKFSKP